MALNKKLREIAMENEKVLNLLLGAVIAIGSILSLYGADRWHKKIQQRDDKIVELQIEKLQIEIANLRRSNQNSSRS